MFTNKLFISTGRTNAMYTLRETYQSSFNTIFSRYLCNLSIDKDKALEKALEYSKQSGIELITDKSNLSDELRTILRTPEEILREREESIKKLEQEKFNTFMDFNKELLEKGVYPFGPHQHKEFRLAPMDYITWIIGMNFEPETPMFLVQSYVKKYCSDLILPTPDKDMIVGIVGKRELFKQVQVIKIAGYATQYGWTNVITMINQDGVCLVSKGVFYAEIGETFNVKGTVKEHTEYKGQKQTIIQRLSRA